MNCYAAAWPGESFEKVAIAFDEFDKLFTGRMPGYHGVDTFTTTVSIRWT